MVAFITIYIVDLSGFTQSWRGFIARSLKVERLRPLPPFDCSLCMVWWVCLAYALIVGEFSLPVVAYAALLSFLSTPMGMVANLVKDAMIWLINKVNI